MRASSEARWGLCAEYGCIQSDPRDRRGKNGNFVQSREIKLENQDSHRAVGEPARSPAVKDYRGGSPVRGERCVQSCKGIVRC